MAKPREEWGQPREKPEKNNVHVCVSGIIVEHICSVFHACFASTEVTSTETASIKFFNLLFITLFYERN